MLVVVVIWAGNISIVKAALSDLGPLPFTATRFAAATVVLLLLLRVREGVVRLPHTVWVRLLVLGLVGNTAYQTLFILGLAQTTAANSAMLMGTTPALIALTSGLLGLEKLTRWIICGVALAFTGSAIVMSQQGAALSSKTLKGDLLTLAAAFCWTAYVLGLRALGGRLSTLSVTAFTLLTGTPGLLVLGWPGLRAVRWTQLPAQVWFALAYSSALALVVAYVLYNRNIKRIGGVRTAIYGCAIPLLATLIAWPVLGERPHWWHAAGGALIITGVLLTRRDETSREGEEVSGGTESFEEPL